MATTEAELAGLVARMRDLTARSPDAWADVDLTFPQLRALFVLATAEQPVRVSHLAKSLDMSLASASALSDRLVRLGYVARRDDPSDRRVVVLGLAAKGTRLLARLERRSNAQLGYALHRMAKHEREALATSLRAFLRVLAPDARRSTRAPIKRSA
ncbi:MAG TPA: MarR family transcriptional regulator [Methylomirabilota bacterium]|nr:MarR family transcriptional regulator [Methylomirabilota bacterium]